MHGDSLRLMRRNASRGRETVVKTRKGHPVLGGPFSKEVRRCPTLPQGPPCSTIGAVRLSFRVRNVTGRFPHAMAAETLLMFQSAQRLIRYAVLDRTSRTTQWTQAPQNGVLSSHRLISTGQLHVLPRFHIRPINPVVWLGASHPKVWKSHLEAGFPLRCFQRLSIPNVANQRCSWQNNWHTRGSSNPVLSY